jgi:hypothetical protein
MPDLRADPNDRGSQPTGAIRGMINMLNALRKEYPDAPYAACVFDAPGKTFRDALYPEYKAQRAPMPDDLRSQIAPIHEVVRLLGWTVLAVPGVEADDVIGTLARAAAGQGVEVVISSGDKDLAQLVTPHIVTIVDTMTGKRRDEAGVQAEFGVPARPDAGLPDTAGRPGGQRARREQGRPQDGRQVAGRIRLAGRHRGAGRPDQGRGRREPAPGAGLAADRARVAEDRTDCDLARSCRRPASS